MVLKRVQEKKEKRVRVFMGVFIALLMVMSGFAVFLSGQGSQLGKDPLTGTRYEIDYDTQTFMVKINGDKYNTYFLPSDTTVVAVDGDVTSLVTDASVVVTAFDPAMSTTNLQYVDFFRFDMDTWVDTPLIGAISAPSDEYTLPLVLCENATLSTPVFSFEEAEDPAIIVEQNGCVRLLGNETSFLLLRDRFLYEYTGVFDEVSIPLSE